MADRPINVLCLTPQLGRAAGGVWSYLDGLLTEALAGIDDLRPTLAGVADAAAEDDVAAVRASGVDVTAASPGVVPSRYGYAPSMSRALATLAPDVVHAQGLRTGVGRETLRLARPFLLTPHGMFHPQLRSGRSMSRLLIDVAWDRRYIARATCVHATSELERAQVRAAGVRQPIAVVPIGVRADALAPRRRDAFDAQLPPATRGTRRAVFLGILNRKKGLLRLADAWRAIGSATTGWSLIIAGPDDRGHRAEIEARIAELSLGDAIQLIGPVWGDDRFKLLASADVFVLPSDWENFGIVVAEALAAGRPVVTTRGAPWNDVVTRRCGWWCEPTVDGVAAALGEAIALDDAARSAMGARGRAWAQDAFAWPAIGRQMASVYRWLTDRGDRPACVVE